MAQMASAILALSAGPVISAEAGYSCFVAVTSLAILCGVTRVLLKRNTYNLPISNVF